MPRIPPLTTERLTLRDQRVDDAAVFRQLWTERDLRVPPHRRLDSQDRPTADDIATGIRAGISEPGLLTVQRKDTGEVIGYCGLLFHGHLPTDEAELAFELLRAVHNRGYATEAARAVVAWAEGAGYRRLWAGVWDWNLASRCVLEKLGFTDSGQLNPATVHGRSLMTVRESLRFGDEDG